jgi:serine palmitoyltransferase
MNVERYLSLAEAFNVYVLQVPAYHLVIELFLVAWIAKLLLTKNFTPARVSKSEKPTKEEEEELLSEWQPEPLVPLETVDDRDVGFGPVVTR